MFKKPIQIGNKKDLGRKGSLRVIEAIKDPALRSESLVESLIQVSSLNFTDVLIFLRKSDSEPFAFRKEGDSWTYPSLYCMWASRNSLPTVYVGSGVTEYILSGADLMLPGIIPSLVSDDFQTGDVVQLKVSGSDFPFALGLSVVSSDTMRSLPSEPKGKGVVILHYFGDGLWRMGSKTIPPGFSFQKITVAPKESAPTVTVIDCTDQTVHGERPQLDTEQMDQIAFVSFLDVVKTASDSDLPMNASSLYSRMQFVASKKLSGASMSFRKKFSLPVDGDLRLDIKKSSHKSIREFVQFLNESKSLLSFKIVRNEMMIVSFNSSNPTVVGYTSPTVITEPSQEISSMVQITRYYSLNDAWKTLLKENQPTIKMSEDLKSFTDICADYLRSKAPSSSEISISGNEKLFGAKSIVNKQEFSIKFKKDLIHHYSISSELPPRIHRGDPPLIDVSVTRVKGGGGKKFATLITGLEKYFLDLNEMAKIFANTFSVATSIHDRPLGIYLQGDVKQPLVELISSPIIGVPREFIR